MLSNSRLLSIRLIRRRVALLDLPVISEKDQHEEVKSVESKPPDNAADSSSKVNAISDSPAKETKEDPAKKEEIN